MASDKIKKLSLTARLAAQRLWVQVLFLAIWMNPFMRLHTTCSPVFHCYACPWASFACPIGVLAHFSALHMIPFIAIGLLLVTGVLLGTFVCGWICPFGLLQDLFGRIPVKKWHLPGWLGVGRYLVLVGLVLAIPYFFGDSSPLFFCRVCPAGAIEAAIPNTIQTALSDSPTMWPSAIKISLIVLLPLASIFIYRPWCRFLCPLGAIYSIFNLFSLFSVRVKPELCNDCQLCSKKHCRYGADPTKRGNDTKCIECLECTKCEAVVLQWTGKSPSKSENAGAETTN